MIPAVHTSVHTLCKNTRIIWASEAARINLTIPRIRGCAWQRATGCHPPNSSTPTAGASRRRRLYSALPNARHAKRQTLGLRRNDGLMIRRRADRHWRRSATLRPRCKVRLHAEALGQGLIYGDGKLGRVGPPMDQASRCELCHIGHVISLK